MSDLVALMRFIQLFLLIIPFPLQKWNILSLGNHIILMSSTSKQRIYKGGRR